MTLHTLQKIQFMIQHCSHIFHASAKIMNSGSRHDGCAIILRWTGKTQGKRISTGWVRYAP